MGNCIHESIKVTDDVLYNSNQRCIRVSDCGRYSLYKGRRNNELLLNLIFYIVITPVIGTTLTKIMFMSEDAMIVGDALGRIDEVLNEKPIV